MPQTDIENRIRTLLQTLSMHSALSALNDCLPKDSAKRVAALKSIELLLAKEVNDRRERRIQRRIADSKLPEYPTLQSFDFDFQPAFDKDLVMELATMDWVDSSEDLVMLGQSGVGKSHIGKALCLIACSQERRVRYTTCADMLATLFASMADGSLKRALTKYTRPALLMIDDLGYDPIEQEQAREAQLLYKVLEARHGKLSTILTSNLPAESWADYLGDHYLTVALLDRLLYHATAITIDGPSYRLAQHKKRQQKKQKKKTSKQKPNNKRKDK